MSVAEDLADWDARFTAWQRDPRTPITPLDDVTPWDARFTDATIADVKRRYSSAAAANGSSSSSGS